MLAAVRKAGGLSTSDTVLQGELNALKEAKNKGAMLRLFRKAGLPLDRLRESLGEQGFHFDTPSQMLEAIHDTIRTGKPKYGGIAAGAGVGDKSFDVPEPGKDDDVYDASGNRGERQTIEDRARQGDPRAGADLTRRSAGTSTSLTRSASVHNKERAALIRWAAQNGKIISPILPSGLCSFQPDEKRHGQYQDNPPRRPRTQSVLAVGSVLI